MCNGIFYKYLQWHLVLCQKVLIIFIYSLISTYMYVMFLCHSHLLLPPHSSCSPILSQHPLYFIYVPLPLLFLPSPCHSPLHPSPHSSPPVLFLCLTTAFLTVGVGHVLMGVAHYLLDHKWYPARHIAEENSLCLPHGYQISVVPQYCLGPGSAIPLCSVLLTGFFLFKSWSRTAVTIMQWLLSEMVIICVIDF